jgi:hypothetical protein
MAAAMGDQGNNLSVSCQFILAAPVCGTHSREYAPMAQAHQSRRSTSESRLAKGSPAMNPLSLLPRALVYTH